MKILSNDYGMRSPVNRLRGTFRLGVDVGSTTSKLALVSSENTIVRYTYRRHQADVMATLFDDLSELAETAGDIDVYPVFTGSAGMGLAERTGLPFVQEVVAASKSVLLQHPRSKMLVDIGGEDCKMIFFDKRFRPDMRMNGNCAGGTGAFIDQMSCLVNLSPEQFDELALQGQNKHTIASRCGVFAKTDVQNLINTGVPKSDIARSVFSAVACQVVSSLARGRDIQGPVVLVGGPLHFFESLKIALLDVLSLSAKEAICPEEALIYPAYGAALALDCSRTEKLSLAHIIRIVADKTRKHMLTAQHRPLFSNRAEFAQWQAQKNRCQVAETSSSERAGPGVFLGIDAGSTTTKIVAVDAEERIVFKHYTGNKGEPLHSVRTGLSHMLLELGSQEKRVDINRSVVTGYGEELIKIAFAIDDGVVETIAHYRAAKKLEKDVSFVLDIGGQDMKAIFIKDGMIHHIEINEACSSGCGSFIETFADSLDFTPDQFGKLACASEHPVDLGSRCTVFMNSCVKQALRQGNRVADVAAGLAYSVIQNCLHKVLRVSDASVLGDRIVVQGGTFKNPAVLRALENLLETEVIRPTISEYMGAYGAALIAKERFDREKTGTTQSLEDILTLGDGARQRHLNCRGCMNHCSVRALQFSNDRTYYTGNRCERIFTNRNHVAQCGENLVACKNKLLARYPEKHPEAPFETIGIPMVLNNFENYPFWATFFAELGWSVVRSSSVDGNAVKDSAVTVMSDNICYPAKIAHAHILDLIRKKVDRIFYPRVVFEYSEFDNSANHFNCPIVSGYPDVIESAVDPGKYSVPLDSPTLNFNDERLLQAACLDYVAPFGIEPSACRAAFVKARQAMDTYKEDIRRAGKEIIEKARAHNQRIIILGSRPYHDDPSIHHGIPELIAGMGVHVITADALPLQDFDLPESPQVTDQWEYSNRLYRAAHWVGTEPLADFIQLNSFGCGPDAIVIDEIKSLLKTYALSPVVLKIDEITSIGSAHLRIRSLLESQDTARRTRTMSPRINLPIFAEKDRNRTILVPDFSPFYSFFAESAFIPMGYKIEILPPPDKESVKTGLKYANNDICYPAIVTIGDILKALESGKYDPAKIAVGLTETGGQCRATNYVSILKKALLSAGYDTIPVISATFSKESSNEQPGFTLNKPRLACLVFSSLMVIDQLVRMYHATAVREQNSGQSLTTLKTHLENARKRLGNWTVKDRTDLLERAIEDFNNIPAHRGTYPRAGLVGEIYVKYNPFSNGNIVDRLMKNGIQVVVPPLLTFFLQKFINVPFNHENHIQRAGVVDRQRLKLYHYFIDYKIDRVNKLMKHFRYTLEPIMLPKLLSAKARKIINLCNQAGEGWLLAGEIAAMSESGIRNIICVQPFGCIANHIAGKGISSKISRLYPELNLLNLDMDAGNSDANIQNRLDFFIHAAREHAECQAVSAN